MASRWLQEKRAKQKKWARRRAALRRYSLKSTGPNPAPGYVNDQGDKVDLSLGSRNRAAKSLIPSWLELKFRDRNPDNTPGVVYARLAGLHGDLVPKGEDALAYLTMKPSTSGGGSFVGETKYVPKIFASREDYEFRLYLSRESAFFVEMKVIGDKRLFRMSIEYSGDLRAMDAHVRNAITWVETEVFPIPPKGSSGPTS